MWAKIFFKFNSGVPL